MKKTSWAVVLIVLLGGGFVGLWIYNRYIKATPIDYVTYTVTKGPLKDLVRVRGEVVAENAIDLSFPFAGTVQSVNVTEGQMVASGTILMALEATDFELELKKTFAQELQARAAIDSAQSQLLQYQSARDAEAARLQQLQSGTRPEQIDVQQSRVTSAKNAVAEQKSLTMDTIQNAGTTGDDAIRNTADQLMQNARTENPNLAFTASDSQLERAVELQRYQMEAALTAWKKQLTKSNITTIDADLALSKANLTAIKNYLEELALALNGAIPSPAASQTTIDTWKTNISLTRTAVNTAIASLSTAESQLRSAESSVTIAQNELTLLKAGTAQEQIAAQQAAVRQANAAITTQQSVIQQQKSALNAIQIQENIIRENIAKSQLVAPGQIRIMHLGIKQNEYYRPGMSAINVSTIGNKIQSDISELDIRGIHIGNPVQITFDAIPEQTFSGVVTSIDPQPVIKDGDKYFRANMTLNQPSADIRTGMNADLVIEKAEKQNVIRVPVYAVIDELGKKIVQTMSTSGAPTSVDVQTGISDGESIEIISGLQEGQRVVVPSD